MYTQGYAHTIMKLNTTVTLLCVSLQSRVGELNYIHINYENKYSHNVLCIVGFIQAQSLTKIVIFLYIDDF